MIDWLLGGEIGPAGELLFLTPDWIVWLAGLAAVLAWVLASLGERPLWARALELLLWGLALAGLVLAVARPTWVEEQGRVEPGRLAVLVDASRSMAVLEDGAPRSDAVAPLLDRLDGADVDVYRFGSDLSVGAPEDFTLPGTDLEGALDALSERVAGERLAGVVVLTDGLDRGLLRRRYQREERPVPPRLPGPLTIYQVGSAGDLRDLVIRDVSAGGYAFRSEDFTITAQLDSVGYAGRRVTATLERDGAPVTARSVTLDDEGQAQVSFQVTPDAVGRFTFEVSVPVWDDDAVPANNRAPVVVRVVRDRMSVLQVAGAPSWDVKFMRRFLKGDPSVDLVSFFILRTLEDIRGTDYVDDELSLIQFPYHDLFSEELENFDVVIFQNFDHETYFQQDSRMLLDNIRAFVEEDGKGFVMIGGERSFDMGGYAGTFVEDMLPVELGVQGQPFDATAFRPTLTEDGRRHPITRLSLDPAENVAWWERLSENDGVNKVRRASPGATVLLHHPTLTGADGAPMPVLSVAEAGEGRAMALTIDTSWRWSFTEAAQGRGNQAYLRFWKNAFRWLVKDPSTSRVTVDTPRENYGVGDTVRVVVRARDEGFAPLPRAQVQATISGPGGTTTLEGLTSADGEVALEVPASDRGAHRVQVEVRRGGGLVGEDETVYAVTTRDPELDEVAPDAAFLQWLALATDGAYHGPGDRSAPLRDPDSGRTVWERRETALWRAPLLGIGILLFGGLAWFVRRRSGLR